MCNFLHRNDIRVSLILETGIGWKLKSKRTKGFWPPIRQESYRYTFDKDGWCHWDEVKNHADGFCFFINKKEAERAAKMWGKGGEKIQKLPKSNMLAVLEQGWNVDL